MPIRASGPLQTWGKSLLITLGVAAAAAAAQLGIAYGFAILLWAKDFNDLSGAAWAANLTWVCWLAATAVVIGAIVGGRITEAAGLPQTFLTHAAVMASAAIGALVTVPLVAVPARYADLAGDGSPAYTAGRIAVLGVAVGAVVSVGVLLGRPLAWNIVATNSWLWLLALGSVLLGLRSGRVPETVRLGIWGDASGWLAVMVPLLLVALAIGAGIAYLAKRQGANRVAVAVCGAPGPVLIAVAYLMAGPGSRPETGAQFLPYLAAPYAVLTGLLASLLVAAIERPEPDTQASAAAAGPAPVSAPPTGPDPTNPDPSSSDSTSPDSTNPDSTGAHRTRADLTGPELTSQDFVTADDFASLEPSSSDDSAAPDLMTPDAATPEPKTARPFPPGPFPSDRSSSHTQSYPVTAAQPVVQQPIIDAAPVGETEQAGIEVVLTPPAEPAPARFGVLERSADHSAAQQFPPVPAAEPKPKKASSGRHKWDEDEAWLEQIKGDAEVRRPRPSPGPQPRRRSWSLFSDDSEPFDTPGPIGGGDSEPDQR